MDLCPHPLLFHWYKLLEGEPVIDADNVSKQQSTARSLGRCEATKPRSMLARCNRVHELERRCRKARESKDKPLATGRLRLGAWGAGGRTAGYLFVLVGSRES